MQYIQYSGSQSLVKEKSSYYHMEEDDTTCVLSFVVDNLSYNHEDILYA